MKNSNTYLIEILFFFQIFCNFKKIFTSSLFDIFGKVFTNIALKAIFISIFRGNHKNYCFPGTCFDFCCGWHCYTRKQKEFLKTAVNDTYALNIKTKQQNKNMDKGQKNSCKFFLKMLCRGWFSFVIITEKHGIDYLCGLVGPLIAVHKGVDLWRGLNIPVYLVLTQALWGWADPAISWELVMIKHWTWIWKPAKTFVEDSVWEVL